MTLTEKLESLPAGPGCYIYKDAAGKVIYVGKAKILRNRVRQYFQNSRNIDIKTTELVSRVCDLEYIVTDNEVEALVLESNLIKRHKPRFNVLLKDDKQYPHIKFTINEPFPRAMLVRRIANDGALYFGPFLPASLARDTLRLINKLFQLRTCEIEIDGKRDRPCLEYHIKRCLGPCVKGLCTPEDYKEAVRDVRLFLEGKNKDLLKSLEERMLKASDELRFELAARYRDQIRTVERLSEQQKMMQEHFFDIDIFGYYRNGPQLALQLFTMREGKIIGKREFYWEDITEPFDPREFLSEAIDQYYAIGNYVPNEVHVPVEIVDTQVLSDFLSEKRGRRVRIVSAQRGQKREMIDLVEKNAKINFDQRFRVLQPDMQQVLEDLQETLDLPDFPARIESFDISHIQGAENVASMVVCDNGVMNKKEYRKFIIKSVEGADDFKSMYEAVSRRYTRLLAENKQLPSLVLIDGGVGQLHAAAKAMADVGLEALPMVAIAKKEELLFVKGREHEPIYLDRHSRVLHLFQMVRDETHRFAVTFHRQRRTARDFNSELTSIPGVGAKLRTRLLSNFGSLKRVSEASEAELIPFVGQKQARKIVEHFASLAPEKSDVIEV